MKKIFIAMALSLVCATFFSCVFKSKEQRDVEKLAMEDCKDNYGRTRAKYHLEQTEVITHPAKIFYEDIVYHVAHIYQNKRGIIAYDVDSVGVERRDYPEINEYHVTIKVTTSEHKIKHPTYTYVRHNGESPDWKKYDNTVIIDKKMAIKPTRYHLVGWELIGTGIEEGLWFSERRLEMNSKNVRSEELNK